MFFRQIEQRNYEAQFPEPDFLAQHKETNPDSFYIQIIGARGAGKSSFTNMIILEKFKGSLRPRAKTGTKETTTVSQFIDLTPHIKNLPSRYKKVFLVDQPGIGGQEIGSENYLQEYGIGMNTWKCRDPFMVSI